ncbi:hypothetical protein [Pseudomonas brenneri]
MTDYTELKLLLEACRAENCDGPREFRKAVEALFDVCTVETISSLITENERLNAECKQLILLECHGGTAEAAINLLAESDQLKAENEALLAAAQALRDEWRKDQADAERYRWLRDSSESIHQFYLSKPIWFSGVKFSKENVDSTIDAAMGKGEQS